MKNSNAIHSILLIFVFFISSLSAQTMYISQKSGTSVSYDVNTVNKMTFSNGNMNVIKVDNASDMYALSTIQHVRFGEIPSALRNITVSNKELSVFPNPVKDILNIKNIPSENSTIVITSIEGKQMMTKQLNSSEHVGIDVSRLPNGFYLCKLYNGTNILSTKFLKQ
jgi:poly(beta-D-mannuronate) lyase